ncbi:MAG: DegV family protein [Bacillales bacterium]|nr:DegV family protein [Bacillales bacterium]
MAIKLLVDSASDISKEEAEKLNISMIPLIITFGQEDFYDGVDILPNQFFEKLIESTTLPKTSQINPFRFEEEFEKLTKNGDELIVIMISSKLSGTYESAIRAKEKFKDNVFVIDSLNACIGERLLCQLALILINENKKSAKEIVDELNIMKTKIRVLALLDTLEYLRKGGRISSLVAFAGEMLSIKPVVAIIEGKVKLVGKARGSKNGKNLLNKLVNESGGIDFSLPYGTVYSGLDNSLLKKYVKDSSSLYQEHTNDIPSYQIGSTIGTHVGPGAIGVAFFEK